MAKKRVTRKQLLKEPDEFITSTGRLITWARENTRALIYGASILVGLVLIISLYNIYTRHQAGKAQTMLGQAIAKYQAELGEDQTEKALSAVRTDFDALVNDYAGQQAGRMGRVVYGHYCMAGGALDDAITHYQAALKSFSDDASLANVILNGLGSAYQQKGEYQQAMTYYKRIVDGTHPMLKDAAMFNLGRLHEQMGEDAEGKALFEKLSADFPNSFYANLVQ